MSISWPHNSIKISHEDPRNGSALTALLANVFPQKSPFGRSVITIYERNFEGGIGGKRGGFTSQPLRGLVGAGKVEFDGVPANQDAAWGGGIDIGNIFPLRG
uniref:Uncharacterized protein n=1 Tax=Populus alba TaxID=43335 RepID=A0A4U5PLT2_POPAL|nr:hypothetical protein D5086_0000206730 [Populus alba]